MTPYNLDAREKAKMHSDDRIFILQPIEGEHTLTTKGAPDKRLFNGENNLHAIRDIKKGTWFLRYDNGTIPETLKGEFLEFNSLVGFVTHYFANRNIKVVSVQ